ncbi:hypothetical protein [Pontivivens ytuae]|uniref:Uncharacterized protein n=1 Tax=Pontivivens ytuae TaxID=2789856 RepID=A0A7S9LSC4_9RHOB|nr:hypothetical protein [Pontivivens ytuae]QPH54236.1 hypothetical protein I0K15_00210 [Pontivivens ytuae]
MRALLVGADVNGFDGSGWCHRDRPRPSIALFQAAMTRTVRSKEVLCEPRWRRISARPVALHALRRPGQLNVPGFGQPAWFVIFDRMSGSRLTPPECEPLEGDAMSESVKLSAWTRRMERRDRHIQSPKMAKVRPLLAQEATKLTMK